MEVVVKFSESYWNLLFKLSLQCSLITDSIREQQSGVIYGVKGVGKGAAHCVHVTSWRGAFSRCRGISSIGAQGGGKKRPQHRSSSRGRDCLLPPVQSTLWKLEERLVNPKESNVKSAA